jgi:hypothetical protein
MQKKPKFLIAAPSYDNRSGGCMVLHQLCHFLNNITAAYVVPLPMGHIVNWLNHGDINQIVQNQKSSVQAFKTCPDLNTPLFTERDIDTSSFVAVYPEIVLGNPFQSTNVARWILYHSGYHAGINCISRGEVEFKFEKHFTGSIIKGFNHASDLELKVVMPNKNELSMLQNNCNSSKEDLLKNRTGTAFTIRKGKFTPHELVSEDSICIDGKSREEICEIFQKVKYFVSYDPHTFYSHIAAVYGCYSLIVEPEKTANVMAGTGDEQFEHMPWIATRSDQLDQSWDARKLLLKYFEESLSETTSNVESFYNFWLEKINCNSTQ